MGLVPMIRNHPRLAPWATLYRLSEAARNKLEFPKALRLIPIFDPRYGALNLSKL